MKFPFLQLLIYLKSGIILQAKGNYDCPSGQIRGRHMDKEQLGKLITELRKRENISQKILAEKLNIVPSTLCKWEKGYSCPDLSYLNQITEILNVSYEELLHPEETLQHLSQISATNSRPSFKHPIQSIAMIYHRLKLKAAALFQSKKAL